MITKIKIQYQLQQIKRDISCRFTGHKMVITQRFSDNFLKVKCEKCNRFFGVNHQLKSVLRWDKTFDAMVAVCYSIPNKNG